jgi:Protein of unknown function (DUF3618)
MTAKRPTDDKDKQAAPVPAPAGQPRSGAARAAVQEPIPSDPQALAQDIERTRQQLGDSVEALVAKADVSAQVRGKAVEMKGRVAGAAGVAADRITAKTADLRHQLPAATSDVTQAVAAGGAKAWQITPAPVQQATTRAARTVRERPGPYAATAGVLLLLGWLVWRRGRR